MNKKSIILLLVGILHGDPTSQQRKHHDPRQRHYKPHTGSSTHHSNSDETHNIDKSAISSEADVRAKFDELATVGMTTHIMRWIIYLWRDKTEEDIQQERLEGEIAKINNLFGQQRENAIGIFVTNVRFLQGRMGAIYKKLQSDANYIPNIIFNNDGSIVLDRKTYTFAEVAVADIDVEKAKKLEEVIRDRLIRVTLASPLPYFAGDVSGNFNDVMKVIRNNFNVPDRILQQVLEIVCAKDNFKKISLKIHPDKNRDNVKAATEAFNNYGTLAKTYQDKSQRKKWDNAFAKV